jgi:hypothetical protein
LAEKRLKRGVIFSVLCFGSNALTQPQSPQLTTTINARLRPCFQAGKRNSGMDGGSDAGVEFYMMPRRNRELFLIWNLLAANVRLALHSDSSRSSRHVRKV